MADKRLTIEDIARLAGVSKATVSRVLNGKPDVDPATRARIRHLMDEQGFVPSATATNLAGGRSHLVGMVVRSYTWLFIPEIMRAVADLIDRTTYELILYRMNDQLPNEDGVPAINRLLVTDLTAAVLGVFPGQVSAQLAALSRNAVPVALIDDQHDPRQFAWGDLPVPWITCDNITGAYEAVRHLVGHGHQRIAHIQGPLRWLCARERHEGYCQALEEAGLPIDPLLVREGDFTSPTGQAAAEELFSLPKEQRPTAIFASSDLMAYGVLAAAKKYAISIPGDVALVGFDDLDNLAESVVIIAPGQLALTTIRQPFYQMGQYAMELLFSLLEVPFATGYRPVQWPFSSESFAAFKEMSASQKGIVRLRLPTQLIVRASCGCNNSAALADEAPSL